MGLCTDQVVPRRANRVLDDPALRPRLAVDRVASSPVPTLQR